MDLKILEIASNTENHRLIKNYTHQSKNKNPLCGDEMEISLIVKDNIVQDIGYQCRSCVYCQASVSLLSKWVMQAPIEKISNFVSNAEFFFDENLDQNSSTQVGHEEISNKSSEPSKPTDRYIASMKKKLIVNL